MKKIYVRPSISEVILGSTQMLCGSIFSTIGIGYGGVDNNGTSDPASRSHNYNNWDEDDEEDEE